MNIKCVNGLKILNGILLNGRFEKLNIWTTGQIWTLRARDLLNWKKWGRWICRHVGGRANCAAKFVGL